MEKALFACTLCRSFSTTNKGGLHAHLKACSRRREIKRAREEEVAAQAELHNGAIRTHDAVGNKLWLHEHNNRCEICDDGGNLLMCSYCNTAWHLGCLPTPLSAAPEGLWMCPQCVDAMDEGEDMGMHGAGIDGAVDDGQDIDADENIDVSDAAFVAAGIAPLPDWSQISQKAYDRALTLEAPEVIVDTSTVVDRMLNALKSRHAVGIKLMLDIDDILQFLVENPDQTFTPTRLRMKALSELMQERSPEVSYQVGRQVFFNESVILSHCGTDNEG